LSGPDLDLLRAWRNAGKELHGQIENLDVNDIARIRKEADKAIADAVKAFARKK